MPESVSIQHEHLANDHVNNVCVCGTERDVTCGIKETYSKIKDERKEELYLEISHLVWTSSRNKNCFSKSLFKRPGFYALKIHNYLIS